MSDSPLHPSDRALLVELAHRAMLDRGFAPDFSPAARHQLTALGSKAAENPNALDLRHLLWASIDNDDSRDLDQLTVAEELPDGRVRILVAIADVDSLVRQGSAIDEHAARNTTSIYTPAILFPLLPEGLSTDLTSLNPQQDRLAVVADLEFDVTGILRASAIYRAQVHSHAQLAYPSVAAWLQGDAPPPPGIARVHGLAQNLRCQDRLAAQLAARRIRLGSLTLETRQTRAIFAGDSLAELEPERRNRAKQVIEEFMIAANGATARYLGDRQFPSLRRVLRSPERWGRIAQLAADLGHPLPATANALALEDFLQQQRRSAPDSFADLSLAIVKLIGRGEYVLELPGTAAPGHFGLAVRDYTHSTAPNRRFPDLITQRLLKAALAEDSLPYSVAELIDLARHCTEREDAANKVERQVQKSAAALMLTGRLGDRFEAVVTGASAKGTWVRIESPPVEGRMERGTAGLDVGDRIRVRLVHTDVQRGFIDFDRDVTHPG